MGGEEEVDVQVREQDREEEKEEGLAFQYPERITGPGFRWLVPVEQHGPERWGVGGEEGSTRRGRGKRDEYRNGERGER